MDLKNLSHFKPREMKELVYLPKYTVLYIENEFQLYEN